MKKIQDENEEREKKKLITLQNSLSSCEVIFKEPHNELLIDYNGFLNFFCKNYNNPLAYEVASKITPDLNILTHIIAKVYPYATSKSRNRN